MAAGTLKLWNIERGFGFIQDDANCLSEEFLNHMNHL